MKLKKTSDGALLLQRYPRKSIQSSSVMHCDWIVWKVSEEELKQVKQSDILEALLESCTSWTQQVHLHCVWPSAKYALQMEKKILLHLGFSGNSTSAVKIELLFCTLWPMKPNYLLFLVKLIANQAPSHAPVLLLNLYFILAFGQQKLTLLLWIWNDPSEGQM